MVACKLCIDVQIYFQLDVACIDLLKLLVFPSLPFH